MAQAERVELELGFEGGGIVRCAVVRGEAKRLAQAFGGGGTGLVALATDGGRVVVDLRRVVYVRELGLRSPIGFGGR
jgi:hypothetical protein